MGGRSNRLSRLVGIAAVAALCAASAALAAGDGQARQRLTLHAQQLESRAHAALLDLYSLDTQLHAANSRLASLEAAAAALHRQRATLRAELAGARSTLKVSRRELALRLRMLYEQGNVDPLAVVFGATSLGTGLAKLDDLTRQADESRQVAAVTIATHRRLLHARRTLAADARRLARSVVAARAAQRSLAAAAQARASYVSQLRAQAQLGQRQVASIVAAAGTATRKTQRIEGSGTQAPSAGGHRLTVSATCYDLPGHTATGMAVGWGVVAVDPSVIPLGTKLYIPGYGNGVAADVGGGIKGAIIDLWMTPARCAQWGRRTVTITVY